MAAVGEKQMAVDSHASRTIEVVAIRMERPRRAAVAAGALALGLVASRFLKASSSRRYSARQTQQSLPPRPATTADAATPATIEPPLVTPTPQPSSRAGI